MSLSTISKPFNFTVGTTANPTEVNSDFDTLYTAVNNLVNEVNDGMGSEVGLDERFLALEASSGTPSSILEGLLTVDGTGCSLDADLVDGAHASATPTASTIPIADGSGKLASGWMPTSINASTLSNYTTSDLTKMSYTEYAGATDIATAIPVDDTKPQITEGTSLLSLSITPKSASSYLLVEFTVPFDTSTTYLGVAALFCTFYHATDAQYAVVVSTAAGTAPAIMYGRVRLPSTSITSRTFTLRVGPGDSGSLLLNQSGSTRAFGGISKVTMTVREISA